MKVCASRPTSRYPQVYDTSEMRKFAGEKGGYTNKQLKGLTKYELCKLAGKKWHGSPGKLTRKYYLLSTDKQDVADLGSFIERLGLYEQGLTDKIKTMSKRDTVRRVKKTIRDFMEKQVKKDGYKLDVSDSIVNMTYHIMVVLSGWFMEAYSTFGGRKFRGKELINDWSALIERLDNRWGERGKYALSDRKTRTHPFRITLMNFSPKRTLYGKHYFDLEDIRMLLHTHNKKHKLTITDEMARAAQVMFSQLLDEITMTAISNAMSMGTKKISANHFRMELYEYPGRDVMRSILPSPNELHKWKKFD